MPLLLQSLAKELNHAPFIFDNQQMHRGGWGARTTPPFLSLFTITEYWMKGCLRKTSESEEILTVSSFPFDKLSLESWSKQSSNCGPGVAADEFQGFSTSVLRRL